MVEPSIAEDPNKEPKMPAPQKKSNSSSSPVAKPQLVTSQYEYAHSHTYANGAVLEPISILKVDADHPFPSSQAPNLVQVVEIAEVALDLLANIAISLTNLLDVGSVQATADDANPAPAAKLDIAREDIAKVLEKIESKANALREVVSFCRSEIAAPPARSQAERPAEFLLELFASKLEQTPANLPASDAGLGFRELLEEVFAFLFDSAIQSILRAAGLYGPASSQRAYADQFQTITAPSALATAQDDRAFAALRVSGPNPLVIERVVDTLPSQFPVSLEGYQSVMGSQDSIDRAIAENRLYLADYAAIEGLQPGQFPQQKYSSAPYALFALPTGTRNLTPVAIQLQREPSADNPIFHPQHGDTWQLAKLHVQAADGNHHELISHLGLTHLLIEPFAVSTHRKLTAQHPVFILLLPHIQGTLFINNAAINSLISPEGIVDRLLNGTIESDWAVTTQALGSLDFNARMLPNELASRRLANAQLPLEYPYRDDALSLWAAIGTWVRDYLAVYYTTDGCVAEDDQLQAWVADLTSREGGGISGLGQLRAGHRGIYTREYLAEVLTMVVFTASAQHAAVNFPQRSVMSYTPALPLANYAPPPSSVEGTDSQGILATLPPLQQSLVQQLVGQGLGGVYFTRLGDYDRHQHGHYFRDTRVHGALESFRDRLDEVEREIGVRNLSRSNYATLLPSKIPQSINI